MTEDVDKVLKLPPDELNAKMAVVKSQLSQGKGSFFALEVNQTSTDDDEKAPLVANGNGSMHGRKAQSYSSVEG